MTKTIAISGAGSGIGRATAIRLSSDKNNRLILVGRNKKNLNETQSLLNNQKQHQIAIANVTNQRSLKKSFSKLEIKNLYGIISNAGIGGGNKYGKNDRWNEIITTNLTGTYNFVNELLPYLKQSKNKYKHIVVISSILGKMGVSGYTAYCSSKTGLIGLTKAWAIEFAKEKILVNAVCPGWVETEMGNNGIQKIAVSKKISFKQALDEQMKLVPLGKMSQPEDIANFIAYLVSDVQNSITGQALDINNGAF